jgi:hypothetical protein
MKPMARILLALCRYELRQAWRNVLTWAAVGCLVLIPLSLRLVFSGSIQVNGHPLAEQIRLVYAIVIGVTLINFLSTLYVLCLALERTGSSYLKHNDILVIARSTPRMTFWMSKLAGIWIPGMAYVFAGLTLLILEIARNGSGFLPKLWFAQIPLTLGLGLIATLYLALRNTFGNFFIFFLWLLIMPVLYVVNLWQIYGGVLREAGPNLGLFAYLPQIGSLHSLALGWGHESLWRPGGAVGLINVGLWLAAGLIFGASVFRNKRL